MESVLAEEGADALTIQRISRAAGVPMASVYHFFPTASAAAVAIAQSYFEGFREGVSAVLTAQPSAPWRQLVLQLMSHTVTFYRRHPYAMRLLFGSDHSWRVRQADVVNNGQMARDLALALGHHFETDSIRVDDAFAIAIGIADSVWALSVARHGEITDTFAREAARAAIAYLEVYARKSQPTKRKGAANLRSKRAESGGR